MELWKGFGDIIPVKKRESMTAYPSFNGYSI
jgi:hypothetical protein